MSRILDAGAAAAAFPLGGIGTGTISLGARGELRDWEIGNNPAKGRRNPFSFFAIHIDTQDGSPTVNRVLEARLRSPHAGQEGYPTGEMAGLPRLEGATLRGQYPLAQLSFQDQSLPITVTLTAFSPFVPLNADDSGMPCAILRYTVHNSGPAPVRAAIAGSIGNLIGRQPPHTGNHARINGTPTITWRDDGDIRGLWMTSDLPPGSLEHGTLSLTTPDSSVTAKPQWLYGAWPDGAQSFWNDFSTEGRLKPEPTPTLDPPPHSPHMSRERVGSLAIDHVVEPGSSQDYEFRLTWHFPNRPRGWNGTVIRNDPYLHETIRNRYAVHYADAWAVAVDLNNRLDQLEAQTRGFTQSLYDSTLPAVVLDAAGANISVIRSTTCFRLEQGEFAAWEGSFDDAGSCEGTCTHVWNYAQAMAWLFPDLERSARRTEFLLETRPDGHMNFRTNRIFGSPAWDFHPATDGQLGTIVRAYREWLLSGDIDFLHDIWPALCRALDFAATEWDSNNDNVLDTRQHNTYDIEFYGESSLANSMYFAALLAGAQLADHLQHHQMAQRWRTAAANGAANMDALLYNGEYYQQRIDDVDSIRYQYGSGVLSDQLFGQLLAHIVGLGHLLPIDHVRSAIQSIYTHNFQRNLESHHSVQRTYAVPGEAGLVLCSWPRGNRPKLPFVYSDEVWTGVEYQVAAHLIYEGFVDEGLELVAAVRDRHNGHHRNPWNEAECGHHYARSLASWAVLLACTGQQTNVATGELSFTPAIPGPLRAFFSTGTAWGQVHIDGDKLSLTIMGGTFTISTVTLNGTRLHTDHAHATTTPGVTLHYYRETP